MERGWARWRSWCPGGLSTARSVRECSRLPLGLHLLSFRQEAREWRSQKVAVSTTAERPSPQIGRSNVPVSCRAGGFGRDWVTVPPGSPSQPVQRRQEGPRLHKPREAWAQRSGLGEGVGGWLLGVGPGLEPSEDRARQGPASGLTPGLSVGLSPTYAALVGTARLSHTQPPQTGAQKLLFRYCFCSRALPLFFSFLFLNNYRFPGSCKNSRAQSLVPFPHFSPRVMFCMALEQHQNRETVVSTVAPRSCTPTTPTSRRGKSPPPPRCPTRTHAP